MNSISRAVLITFLIGSTIMVFSFSHPFSGLTNIANGYTPLIIEQTPSLPSLFNLAGEEITSLEVGQQAIIKVSLHNNNPRTESFVVIVEVRDGSGITEFLAWQSGTIEVDADYTMGFSWTPRNMCGYNEGCESREIRSFVLSSLIEPRILSPVYTRSEITIIGSQPKVPFIEHNYDLLINNQKYNIGYSFSNGDGNITAIDVSPETRTMHLLLVTPEKSQFTIMMPKELFDYTFIGNTQKAVGLYVFIDGEDTQFNYLVDFDENTVTYIISIEKGVEEIELRGSLLL